jgi:hypothetical protein
MAKNEGCLSDDFKLVTRASLVSPRGSNDFGNHHVFASCGFCLQSQALGGFGSRLIYSCWRWSARLSHPQPHLRFYGPRLPIPAVTSRHEPSGFKHKRYPNDSEDHKSEALVLISDPRCPPNRDLRRARRQPLGGSALGRTPPLAVLRPRSQILTTAKQMKPYQRQSCVS